MLIIPGIMLGVIFTLLFQWFVRSKEVSANKPGEPLRGPFLHTRGKSKLSPKSHSEVDMWAKELKEKPTGII